MSNVDHPEHYNQGQYECIDIMRDVFGDDAVRDFCKLNAFKYIWRESDKNGDEDLKKAAWYLEKCVNFAETDHEDEETEDLAGSIRDTIDPAGSIRDTISKITEGLKDMAKTIAEKLTEDDKRYEKYLEYKEEYPEKTAFVLALHTKLEEDNEQHDA